MKPVYVDVSILIADSDRFCVIYIASIIAIHTVTVCIQAYKTD